MTPLKILLGNNTLSLLAGSETWTKTLAIELKKMGHAVDAFSPSLGVIAKQMEDKGISCFDDVSNSKIKPFSFVFTPERQFKYDIIIAAHNHIVRYLREQFPSTPIISVIHGILHFNDDGTPAPEHPALDSGVNQFVAVSEEVKEKLMKDYNIEASVIKNFFDVKLFKSRRKINPKPKVIFFNSNYTLRDDPEVQVIREVAKHYDAKLAAAGVNFAPTDNVMTAIEDADIVIGMGRSVLEGVCAGRLGIVHGRWGTGGVVCQENIEDLARYNFSGRNNPVLATAEELITAIDRHYNQTTVDWGRQYVLREHNAVLAAESFVRIARDLTGAVINAKPVDNRKVIVVKPRPRVNAPLTS